MRPVVVLVVLMLGACSTILGDHPFSDGPKSSGHVDVSPHVVILRGQDYQLCANPAKEKSRTLYFFVYLNNMGPRKVTVTTVSGSKTVEAEGELTVKVNAQIVEGYLAYHTTRIEVEGDKAYEMTTVIGRCGDGT